MSIGNNTDFVLIGSDSGRIVVLKYDTEKNTFEKIHQETFGKVGIIRGLPGQYLAVDPNGRAFMISSISLPFSSQVPSRSKISSTC